MYVQIWVYPVVFQHLLMILPPPPPVPQLGIFRESIYVLGVIWLRGNIICGLRSYEMREPLVQKMPHYNAPDYG